MTGPDGLDILVLIATVASAAALLRHYAGRPKRSRYHATPAAARSQAIRGVLRADDADGKERTHD